MKKLCIIISLTCTPTILFPFHASESVRKSFEQKETKRRKQDEERFKERAEKGDQQCLCDFVTNRTRIIGAQRALNNRHDNLTLALLRQLPPAFFNSLQNPDSPNRTDEQVCLDQIYYRAKKTQIQAIVACIDEKRKARK